MHARQKRGACASVIARTVAQRPSVDVSQPAQHQETIPQWSKRFENRSELESGAFGGGRPLTHDDAVRHVHESHAARGLRGAIARRGEGRHHRVEQRQRQCGPQTAKKRTPRKRLLRDDHSSRVLLIWNGGLLTTAIIIADKRLSSCPASRAIWRTAGWS